ncbi:MAG TPA: inositol 2-dehydrogenase [Chthoniobacterales bacterium]|jgi:myo-inositol 2-dehydrogenase/D-chiro-inositol 1-dehydrogenase|nr:inositol 2-dehydrogenase [Chthoniobacterales bacterium]
MKENNRIGVAFLGLGRMGETHLRNVASLSRVKVIAVADSNLQAAERGKAMSDAEVAFTDVEKAIEHPSVDAVVIVTPTDTHARLIEAAAQAGKAVFSEKPIALDLAETARVVNIVRERKIPVQLGFMRRYDPGYARAKQKIVDGELGRIELFRALSRDTYPPRLEFLLGSGGIFLDLAVHDLDLARFLIGEVAEVHAWGAVLFDEKFSKASDVDTAVTMLRFANGALGVVETARHSNWGYDIRTEVAGAVGKIVVEAPQKTPLLFAKDFGSRFDHFENFPDRFEAAYRFEMESFFSALLEGRPVSPGPEDALETLRLALAARKSWQENRPVKTSEIGA